MKGRFSKGAAGPRRPLLALGLCLAVLLAGPKLAARAADPGRVDVPLLDAPARGPADAPVTMVEFIDFQ